MTTIWRFIASFALPAPLALLVLLNLPLPKPMRRAVVTFVAKVLDVPVIGTFKTLHVMFFILGATMASSMRTLQLLEKQIPNDPASLPLGTLPPSIQIAAHSKRWRAERNLWLTAFAFTMWAVLAAFYREMKRRIGLEERLVEFEMSDYTATADVSISREVSSRPRTLPAMSPLQTNQVKGMKTAAGRSSSRAEVDEPPSPEIPRGSSPAAEFLKEDKKDL